MGHSTTTPWTPERDAVLRERYGTVPNAELAADLGRSRDAVKRRARRLNLRHRPRLLPLSDPAYLAAKFDGYVERDRGSGCWVWFGPRKNDNTLVLAYPTVGR